MSQSFCVSTEAPVGGSGGVASTDFAQSLTMGSGCSGVFAGLTVDAGSVTSDGSAAWTLQIYQGNGFGGTLQYTQTGIVLTDIGSGYTFINITGGSGSRSFTPGSQYTFRVSTTSTTNSITVFRNTTSFYSGGQGYLAGVPIATSGDILDVAIFTQATTTSCGGATRLYVKHNASGANNGTSWTNAYTSLQSAIDYARGCNNIQEIWVSSGTYKPSKDKTGNASPSSAANKTFFIDFPIALYGGFVGTETLLSQRNLALNATILSGDLDNNDTANPASTAANIQGVNASLILYIYNVAAGFTADGFTITAADYSTGFIGGGIHNDGTGFPFGCNSTIRNCKIQGHSGTGITNSGNLGSNSAGNATLLIENTSISGNSEVGYGSAIYCNSNGGWTSTTVNNSTLSNNTSTNGGAFYEFALSGDAEAFFSKCIFSDNSVTSSGGAVNANASNAGLINHTFTNCVFKNNSADDKGGAYNANGASSGKINTEFTNCTFYNNEATTGGGAIYFTTNITPTTPMLLRNCILWQNGDEILREGIAPITLSYSLITSASVPSGVSTNNSLFNVDPDFVNSANLRLQSCSPAINSGTATGAPATDLDNNARPALGGYDMGAYETTSGAASPSPAEAGPDQTSTATCGLTQVTLAATTPAVGTGQWSIQSGTGGSFGNLNSPTSTFSGTAGNTYTLRWTVSNSPCTANTDEMVVTFNQAPSTAAAGLNQTSSATCGLTQVTLAATAPAIGTGQWSIQSGTGGSFGNAGSPTSTFSGTAGNTYTLRWTVSNAPCMASTDEMVVTFNQAPSTAAAGADQTSSATCGLTQVTLAATAPAVGTGQWSIQSGTGGSFGSLNSPTSSFSGTAGNTYTLRWTVSNSPCTNSTDEMVVTFNRSPSTADAGPNQTSGVTCGLTQVTLAATAPAVGTGQWSIQSGTGGSFGNLNSRTSTFSGTSGNTYTLRWTVSNAPCTASTDEMVVTFNSIPVMSCPSTITVENDDPSFVLTGGSPSGGTYSGPGVSGNLFNPAAVALGTHTITYAYISGAGCSSSCTFTITVVSGCPAAGTIWYVNSSAASGGNGTSWSCAFQNVQEAINAASNGHEVWVKAGTYKPTSYPAGCSGCSTNRDFAYLLKDGVAVYGGFAGTETARSQRNWATNSTTLSGDIGTVGNSSDNCYHVVFSVNDGNATVLDGFSITGGNANGNTSNSIESISSARYSGGGMQNFFSNARINNCRFFNNAVNSSGAGMNNYRSGLAITNCLFSGNSAASTGGAMFNTACDVVITNTTFSGNQADAGGALYNNSFQGAGIIIKNSLMWNNLANSAYPLYLGSIYGDNNPYLDITYSLIHHQTPAGTGNLDGITYASDSNYPQFVTPLNPATAPSAGGDFHLGACSPVVDKGNDADNTATTDLGALTRKVDNFPGGSLIDLGPYELQGAPTPVVATCQNTTVQLDGAGNGTLSAASLNNNSTGCVTLAFSASKTAFNCSNLGPNTVTLTVTGANGSTGTCTSTVTVADQVAPNALCRDFVKNLGSNGTASITTAEVNNLSSDNCGTVNLVSVAPSSFTCSHIGTNTVTLTVNDGHGNTASCNATVTVADVTAPTALCQNRSVNLNSSGTVSVTAAQINNGSTDNCSIALMNVAPNSFTCANVGVQTVTLTVTDGSNLSSTCSATVTVSDNSNPTAICQNVSVNLNAGGMASVTGAQISNGSSDNCGIASLNVSPSSFTCANVGANSVTLTVTDNNNLTSTCSATVTVADATNPTAVCQNITVNLDGNGNASITGAQIDGGSTDNCGITSRSATPNTFTASNIGANTVTLTVTDNNGRTASCTATVTVTNTNLPNAVCQPYTAVLGTNGSATIMAADVNGGSSAVGGIASMSVSPNTLTCANIGTNTVTLTVVGNNGQQATCNATVTVQDNSAPTVVCQNVSVNLSGSTASVTAGQLLNTAVSSDNCGTVNAVSVSPNSFNCSNLGSNTVTLTVNDGHGNTATCTAVVMVADQLAPTAVCQNVSINLNSAGAALVGAAQVNNGSSDNCGTVNLVSVSPGSFTCSNTGANTVTLTVNDGHGNSSTCTAVVTVSDNLAPSALCRDIVVQLDANGNASITAAQVNNGSSDNCSLGTLSVSPSTFTLANLGVNTVTLTVPDNHGNSSTCTAQVTVENNQLPNAVCQNIVRNLGSNGQVVITTSEVDGGSTALGGIASRNVSPNTLTCSNIGVNTVTLTIVGNNGQQASCNATVTVNDNTAPTAVCQNASVNLNAGGTATVMATQVNNASSDNCGTVNLVSVVPSSFNCMNLGANTVTLTVNDGHGNTATCTAVVMVADQLAPMAVCQNVSVNLSGSTASVTAAQVNNGSSDNCGTVNLVSVVPSSFTCSNLGANLVTLTVNDGHGNTSTCGATVTVNDLTGPTAVCQNVSVNLSAGGTASVTAAQINNGSSDNCGMVNLVGVTPGSFTCSNLGANIVTLTVNDGHGNTSTCGATVTVNDNLAPTAVCQNVSVNLNTGGTASVTAAQINNGSSDNCGTVNIVGVSPASFNCNTLGANTVTLTVNDGHGNSATCTAVVMVADQLAPTAVCQNVSVNLNAGGTVTVTAAQVNNASSDNCNSVNLVGVSPSSFTCSNLGANTVTLTVNDGHNNTATCTAIVTVSDNSAPTANCKAATLQIPVGLTTTLAVSDIDNNSTDNCGVASRSLSSTSFNCNNLGANTVILTVTDVNGLSGSCTATVTVTDPNSYCCAAPEALCKAATVGLNSSGTASIAVSAVNNNSTYDCGLLSMTVSPNSVNCSNVGAITVTLTVTDLNNHSSQCTATVTVTDPILPAIVCPVNLTRNTDANQCTAMVTYASPTFSDNCSGVSLTRVSGPASGSQFAKGTTMVNWKATDVSGNSSVCGFSVTVNDNQTPTILCPANQTKNADAGQCTALVTYTNPTFSDNCTGASAAIYSGLASGSTFPKGTNSIVWQATDGTGLTSRCTFTITVNDNQLPTITCPANQTKNTDAGQCTAVSTYTTPTFTDNCTGGSVTIQSGLASGSAFPKGINTLIWRATDAAGLAKTCSFRITVNDTEAPAISCPANQVKTTDPNVCTAVATYNAASFTDNCTGGSVVKLSGLNSGAAFPKGTSQLIFRATDGSGNQSVCTMTVTVTDAQLPTVACPANVVATGTVSSGVCSATIMYNTPTASDNCALLSSYLLSGLASGSVYPEGVTTNVWRATDESGLSATCAFTVSVNCPTLPETMNDERGTMNEEQGANDAAPSSFIVHRLSFHLAPNPATTTVTVILEGLTESGGHLTVFDAQGRVVWQQSNVQHPTSSMDVSDLPTGLYQVRLQTGSGVVTKGLVVSRW